MITPPTPCPDREQLRSYWVGEMPTGEHAALLEHVDSCPECQLAVGRLATAAEPTACIRSFVPFAHVGSSASLPATRQVDPAALRTPSPRLVPVEPALDFLEPPQMLGSLGRLGAFEVLEVLGRGGMGVVLKAFDPALRRAVALKVLDAASAGDETSRQRFCREARAAAAVSHENVIAIHQVALDDGCPLPFIVMQLVQGETLQARLDRVGPLPVKEVLRIGLQVAAGLAAAHAQGLIHRDIKPDNILLEEGTERVKLTDFGLALAFEDVRLTQPGLVAGTPLYMAPEQARGEPIDHRADLFSLGSLLYAMCTSRPPFRGSTPFLVLRQITDEPARPVREVNPAVSPALAAVIEKLHAKSPADRFQSAAETAEELGRQLALLTPPGQVPVALVPVRQPEKRRSPVPLWFRAMVAAVALITVVLWGLARLRSAGANALPSWLAGDVESASFGGPLSASRDAKVLAMAVAPDGGELAAALEDGTVKFSNPATGRVHLILNAHAGRVWAVAFAVDGRQFATAGEDGFVRLWDAATKKEMQARGHVQGVRSLAFSADGRQLVLGTADGRASVWDFKALED